MFLAEPPPWTGGYHIMPTHAGKDSIASGSLRDRHVWDRHPALLSRRLRDDVSEGGVSRIELPQGDRKLPVAPRGCILFTLTPGEVMDRLGPVG